jgi:hypothetical protein
VLRFLPYGDAAPVVTTHWYPDDDNRGNAARNPVQQYQVGYYRYRGLRVCRHIRRVRAIIAGPQLTPALHRTLSTPDSALCFVMTNHTADKHVTPTDGDVYLEIQASQDMCRITSSTCFTVRNLC